MRKSKVETAKTRERIIKAAGAEFMANEISEAAFARVMAAAGLTHGGFYRHFASKDQLVLEACSVPADCQPPGDGSVPQASGNVDGGRLRYGGRDHISPHCPRFANLTFCSGCNARLHHPVRAAAAIIT